MNIRSVETEPAMIIKGRKAGNLAIRTYIRAVISEDCYEITDVNELIDALKTYAGKAILIQIDVD